MDNILEYELLSDKACPPVRGSALAAGWDLYAANDEPIVIPSGSTVKIPTGIAIALPYHTFGALYPRSGIATKRGLRLANCVGVVDEDYRGEVMVPIHNDSNEVQIVEPHERICQLIVQPYVPVVFDMVVKLPPSDRGQSGFGSSGKF